MFSGPYASDRSREVYSNPDLPVPILQGKWEFERLLEIYKELHQNSPGSWKVLEIGSLFGGTLWHWMRYSRPGGIVVNIDKTVPDSDPRFAEHVKSHRELWPSWAKQFGVAIMTFNHESTNPLPIRTLQQQTFDFLFIDGGHSYETAKADFLNYGRLVRPGGIIAFHDILPAKWWTSVEVHRLWDEIKQAGYVTQELYASRDQEFMYDRSAWGIGVVYK